MVDGSAGGEHGHADRLTDRIGLGVLTRLVHRDLVDEVLADTGRTERRRRLLPARVVVYFVLAMTLFFDDAYEEVMRKLVEGLRFLRSWDEDWQVPTSSAPWRLPVALGLDFVLVFALGAILSVLIGLATHNLNNAILEAVTFSLLSLVYILVARNTVGFTLGEAVLDVRYHPPWRGGKVPG